MSVSRGLSKSAITVKAEVLFWLKVAKVEEEECWNWTAAIGPDGYGRVWIGRQVNAQQVAYVLSKGDILPGQVIRHSCNNRTCCNPLHLGVGSQLDNVQDRVDSKRTKVVGRKLDEQQVKEIRTIYSTGNVTLSELAEVYGLSYDGIQRVVQRRTWKHIE